MEFSDFCFELFLQKLENHHISENVAWNKWLCNGKTLETMLSVNFDVSRRSKLLFQLQFKASFRTDRLPVALTNHISVVLNKEWINQLSDEANLSCKTFCQKRTVAGQENEVLESFFFLMLCAASPQHAKLGAKSFSTHMALMSDQFSLTFSLFLFLSLLLFSFLFIYQLSYTSSSTIVSSFAPYNKIYTDHTVPNY